MSRGQSTAPPSAATRPTPTCGSAMKAGSAMSTRSHMMATLHPRPTAGPLRAATKGKVAAKQLVGQRPGFTHPVEAVLELVAVGEVGDVASAAEGGPGSGQHH